MYMQQAKFVPASYIPIINSNLPWPPKKKKKINMSNLGTIWYSSLATCFQFLNNITCSSTHFFAHKYFKKIQTTLLKQCYQTAHCYLVMSYPFSNALGPIYYCWNLEAIAQLASEVCQFRHGATSRWTGLPGLFILLCLAIVSYKLQQLRRWMGQMAKKLGLLSLLPLVINQTWVTKFWYRKHSTINKKD